MVHFNTVFKYYTATFHIYGNSFHYSVDNNVTIILFGMCGWMDGWVDRWIGGGDGFEKAPAPVESRTWSLELDHTPGELTLHWEQGWAEICMEAWMEGDELRDV